MLLKKLSTILISFTLLSGIPAKAMNSETSLEPKRFICKDCNENESYVLEALQDQGITDKYALATIMGNIKQESQFVPMACESGGPVPYHRCRRGGTGILQWTDSTRYYGLGNYAKQVNGDPSSLETQVGYLFHENDWKLVENGFKQPGKSVSQYMRYAFRWIRWGIKGPRESYAYDYASRLLTKS